MSKEILYQYNPWWEEEWHLKGVIARPKVDNQLIQLLSDPSIVLLTGLRRVGKTTSMKILIHQLLQQGVDAKHIFYVSLDDYALKDLSILEIIKLYKNTLRIASGEKCYLFLDEITYKADFQVQLKNLYDKKDCKVYVSSSSCSALRDNRGYLTGRERVIEISPLDFEEYLLFRGISLKQRDSHLKASYFEDYLFYGGMPEYVLNRDREYLLKLIDDILYKDIVAFHGIKNPQIVKDYFNLLMERSGKQISINKVANILKISSDSSSRYLSMFLDSFMIYLVSRDGRTNEKILAPRKIYAADLGMRNVYTGFRDKGALFENVVFNCIKKYSPTYLYRDGVELDFLIDKKILIEVKYGNSMNEKQQNLFNEYPAKEKIIIGSYEELIKLESRINDIL